jgi:hypothetical protein
VRVELTNPGAFAGPREGGEGVRVVTKRLELCYGAGVELLLRAEEGRTVTRLDLPRELVQEERRPRS